MYVSGRDTFRLTRRIGLTAALALASGPLVLSLTTGCQWTEEDRIAILTNWSEAECLALSHSLQSSRSTGPILIDWIRVSPETDLASLVEKTGHSVQADVLLGGAPTSYRQLAAQGHLHRNESDQEPSWIIVRRRPVGLAVSEKENSSAQPDATIGPSWTELADPSRKDQLALGDPRRDPDVGAWAISQLNQGPWTDQYGRLVRTAANAQLGGFMSTSTLEKVSHGEARFAISSLDRLPSSHAPGSPVLRIQETADRVIREDGAAILQTSQRHDLARGLLLSLKMNAFHSDPRSPGTAGPEPGLEVTPAAELTTGLLGATLIDSHRELRRAWESLLAAGRPEQPERWMTEPPPWPPASISKLIRQSRFGNDDSADWLDTLAAQIAPDQDSREWLRKSWNEPSTPIDQARLDELATAVGGRLLTNPRFRNWLRAEWTAWSSQRYRRVERLVQRGQGVALETRSSPP